MGIDIGAPRPEPGGSAESPVAFPFTIEETEDYGRVVVLDGQVFLAVKLPGDAFPRWWFGSTPGQGIYMGDGTFDPTDGPNVFFDVGDKALGLENWMPDGVVRMWNGGGSLTLKADGTVEATGAVAALAGVILIAPDTTQYRLTVDNDGVISTEVVV